ncbi:MAG TPA: hypothetical protein VF212_04010 [Longimicrobiales bacterium]
MLRFSEIEGARPGRRAWTVAVALVCASAAMPAAARAQEPATPSDSMRAEIARLRAQLDSLIRVVQRLEAQPKAVPASAEAVDPLAALRAAAAAAAATGEAADADTTANEAGEFVGRQRSLQALNPEITVTGDLFAIVNADEPGQDNFVPREFELAIQSSLDPYSRAKIYLGRHQPGGELAPFGHADGEAGAAEAHAEAEIEIEEGYVEWVNLPGGLGVTLGKFRQRFGTLNRWHPHSLPGQQLPLPVQAFFGEHGLAQTGVSLHWLAPVHGFGTYELWTELTRSGNETLFGESAGLSTLAHLNAFYDLGRATYFELGLTGLAGPNGVGGERFGTRVGGVDFALSWRPPERAHYREATLRGGAVYGRVAPHVDPETGAAEAAAEDAFGAFAIGEYRLNRRWVVGARYEYTQDPAHPEESAWLVAPTLTWWQSEYVRLRLEYDYLRRPEGLLRQLVLQTTVAMGPHKHETY